MRSGSEWGAINAGEPFEARISGGVSEFVHATVSINPYISNNDYQGTLNRPYSISCKFYISY